MGEEDKFAQVSEGLWKLQDAIYEIVRNVEGDHVQALLLILVSEVRCWRTRHHEATDAGDAAKVRAVQVEVHGEYGAPGDWGYDSPIGKALCKIYGC